MALPLPLCTSDEDIDKFPFVWVAGDCFPELVAEYLDENGDGVDLSGFTITLHLVRPDKTVLVKTATAVNLLLGQFKITWVVGDLLAGCDQKAEIQFVDGAGCPLTSKLFSIDVREQIA